MGKDIFKEEIFFVFFQNENEEKNRKYMQGKKCMEFVPFPSSLFDINETIELRNFLNKIIEEHNERKKIHNIQDNTSNQSNS